jgi:hypothetical protein
MGSAWDRIAKSVGGALYRVHKSLGRGGTGMMDYYLCTAPSTDGLGLVQLASIPCLPATDGQIHEHFGGRERAVFQRGMGQSMTGIDFFIFSRKAFFYNNVYYWPDIHDSFFKAGYTSLVSGIPQFDDPAITVPEYQVKTVKGIGPGAAGFILEVQVQYHVHAGG